MAAAAATRQAQAFPLRKAGTRLLVCDDSAEARAALRTMLTAGGEIEVVGEARDGAEAVALASELSPDVVLMDVAMPVLDGIAATRRIRRLVPAARIVAFAGSSERETVSAMLEAGASAYCVKGAPLWELERAIAGASEPLVRLAHALAKAASFGGTGELVARELSGLSGGAVVAVYLAAPDVGLSLAGLAGTTVRDGFASAPGAALRAFRNRAAVRAAAAELNELRQIGAPCREAVGVPLVSDGETFGAVLVGLHPGTEVALDLELVSAVADLTAASVATVRRLTLTHAEARRDALTGLPNRRAFDEQLDELFAAGCPVGVALLDLDDFKQINDRDGHQAGDDVLREVSRVVLRCLRAKEQVYRVGGEEFALVLEGGANAAARVVDRLRAGLREHRRSRRLPTLCAGVAGAWPGESSREELLRDADAALYAAKRAGKDRVVVSGAAVDDALAEPVAAAGGGVL